MLRTLEYIRTVLETDDNINELLSTYGELGEELPSIAFQSAPNDMPMPYIVTGVQPGDDTNPALNRMVYTTDIYVDKGDIIKAQIIADRVEVLLDKRKLPVNIGVGIWRDSKFIITNEDDPEVQHYHLSFIVRYNRIY